MTALFEADRFWSFSLATSGFLERIEDPAKLTIVPPRSLIDSGYDRERYRK